MYKLNDNIKDCDVILTDGGWNVVSGSVKIGTLSRYSHAAIFLEGRVFESTGGGVFDYDVRRLIVNDKRKVCVLRYLGGIEAEHASKMMGFLRDRIGTSYSVKDTLKIGVLKFTKSESAQNREFCSRLVSQAFEAAGINLFRNPDFCSPAGFVRLKGERFEDVTEECLSEISDTEVSAIESIPNVAEKNRDALKYWLDKVKALPEAMAFGVDTENSILEFLAKYPQYDSQVESWIRESGYLDNWKMVFDQRGFGLKFSKSHLALEVFHTDGQSVDAEYENVASAQHWVESYKAMLGNYLQIPLRTFGAMLSLYYRLVSLQKQRLQAMIEMWEDHPLCDMPWLRERCNEAMLKVEKLYRDLCALQVIYPREEKLSSEEQSLIEVRR